MSVVIGIDVGGSTTKIVGFSEDKKLIAPLFVKATDQITSIYGALGKFTSENGIELSNISKLMVTGVGSSHITKPIYNINCEHVSEFSSVGRGGLYLSGLDKAIVVSMGTGTAIVYSEKGGKFEYLGGTGVGGGTLIGLSKKLLGLENIDHIIDAAKGGDLSKIDLRVNDITMKSSVHPGLMPDLTASNFGRVSDIASKNDLALGLLNMIFETIAMLSVFAARSKGISDIVLTGNLTYVEQTKPIFYALNSIFNVNFIIPDNSQFGTVIGAALSGAQ